MEHDEIIAMAREEGLSFVPDASSPLVRKKGDKAKRAEDLRKAIHCIQLLAQHEGIELGEAAQPSAVPYIGPDRRACGNDLSDMVRAEKSVVPEDAGGCGNVGVHGA